MRNTLLFAISLLWLALNSQSVKWVKTEPFPSHWSDYTKSIVDSKGSVYVYSKWYQNGSYFVKYDAAGNKEWDKPITGLVSLVSLAIDKSDILYLVLKIGNTTKIQGKDFEKGNIFLKFKPDGELLWAKRLTEGYIPWFDKEFDSNNRIMVTGAYDGAYNKFGLPNTTELIKPYVGEMDTSGSMIWAKPREGSIIYSPTSSDNGLFTHSYMPWNYTLGEGNDTVSLKHDTYFVSRYDRQGKRIYAKHFDYSGTGCTDKQGNYYLFEWVPRTVEGHVKRIDGNGNVKWQSSLFKAADIYKVVMTTNHNGDVFYAGGFKDFLEVEGRRIVEAGYNMFIAKWDSTGNFVSLTTSSGSGFASIRDLKITGKSIYISGDLAGTETIGGVTLTQENGGVFTALLLDDNNSLGVNEHSKTKTSSVVYPNPTHNTLTIQSSITGSVNIRMVDLLGKIIYEEIIQEFNGTTELYLDSMIVGTYILQMEGKQGTETKKVVIE